MVQQESTTRLVAGLLFAFMIFAAIALGSPLSAFFNPPSLVLTVGGGILLTLMSHGFSGLRELARISREGRKRSEFEYAQTIALGAAQQFERIGGIGTGIGFVQMLANMDDPNAIGPALAVAFLTAFYGHFISIAVFHPMARDLDARAKLS